jgi:hypothetical protein
MSTSAASTRRSRGDDAGNGGTDWGAIEKDARFATHSRKSRPLKAHRPYLAITKTFHTVYVYAIFTSKIIRASFENALGGQVHS